MISWYSGQDSSAVNLASSVMGCLSIETDLIDDRSVLPGPWETNLPLMFIALLLFCTQANHLILLYTVIDTCYIRTRMLDRNGSSQTAYCSSSYIFLAITVFCVHGFMHGWRVVNSDSLMSFSGGILLRIDYLVPKIFQQNTPLIGSLKFQIIHSS
jgi:hypothetical protein